jgi:sugar lactone lactonase YvrE
VRYSRARAFCSAGFLAAALAAFAIIPARADNVFISYMGADPDVQEYSSGSIDGASYNGYAYASSSSGIIGPSGLAFNGQGDLFVANTTNGTIDEFTPAGVESQFYSGLDQPEAIAFDPYGDLYVTTKANGGAIFKITPGGAGSVFATVALSPNGSLSSPSGLAFDSSGNLYVTTAGGGNGINVNTDPGYAIDKITPSGQVSIFAESNTTPGGPEGVGFGYLSNPQGLAFDSSGNLYVADFNNNAIEEFNSTGTSVTTFAEVGANTNPHGLAFDSSGDLYVTNFSHYPYPEGDQNNGQPDPGFSADEEYSPTGTLLQTFNDNTASPSGLEDGGYIAIETDSGTPLLATVPEPSSASAFGLGTLSLLGLSKIRRRRRI